MRWIGFVLGALVMAGAGFAADVPEARLKELVRRAAAGQLEEIAGEIEPGAFEARPMVEQVVVCAGTEALRRLVELGEESPLKKAVPAGTWPKLVAGVGTLGKVADGMKAAVHATVAATLAKRDVAASRLLVGTANLYLRQMGEAESAADKAVNLFIAAAAAQVVSHEELQAKLLKLSTDPMASTEVRERARFLYPLIADTAARTKVALLQFHTQQGGR